MSEIKNVG